MDGFPDARLRALPQVQKLLDLPQGQRLVASFPRASVVTALRVVLDQVRTALPFDPTAATPSATALLDRARAALEALRQTQLRRVINATGIVLHTNLGRAVLAPEAIAAAVEAAGYCNLEYGLETGERGSRTQGIEPLLRQLTGAEAALAVNNNAAAVLLALSGLAGGGEVIVSRGELVEIGGGFRIPDVIQQGGARLVEVGTTNKTRLSDYADAITPATRVLLKVHRSNFRITGFTEDTPLTELASLARSRGLLAVHDLGSGAVVDPAQFGLPAETTIRQSIEAGVDVVAFSGDKLFGGPQAGVLAGGATAIDRLRRHPLLRALRLDKLTLAALEATLRLHCDGLRDAVPVLRMLAQTQAALRARADRLVAHLGPIARACATSGYAGGGTLPDAAIASMGVSLHLHDPSPERLKALLRAGKMPVIGRIVDGSVLLDMLTVSDQEVEALADAVREAIAG